MLNCAHVDQGLYPVTRNESTCCFGRNLIHLHHHKLLTTSLISHPCNINSKEQCGTILNLVTHQCGSYFRPAFIVYVAV